MFVNLLIWFGIGILGGFLAYLMLPTKREALPGMLVAGVVGAFTGGVLYSLLRIGTLAVQIDPLASFMALISVVLILNIVRKTVPVEEEFLSVREYKED